MKRVCDIGELPTLSALRRWAHAHRAQIIHIGPDTEGRPVYLARDGVTERVARGTGPDLCAHPLTWRSPLEAGAVAGRTAPPREWLLTIEGSEYVAYRPIGWSGPDPYVRITATTREQLLAKLKGRDHQKEDEGGREGTGR